MSNSMMTLGLMEAVTNVAEKTIKAMSDMQGGSKGASFGDVLSSRISAGEKDMPAEELPIAEIPPQNEDEALSDVRSFTEQLTASEEAPPIIADATAQQAVFLLKAVKSMLESIMKDVSSDGTDKTQGSAQDLLTSLFSSGDDEDDDSSVYDLFGILFEPTDMQGLSELTTAESYVLPASAESMEITLLTDSGSASETMGSLFTKLTTAQSALTERIDALIEQFSSPQTTSEIPQQSILQSSGKALPAAEAVILTDNMSGTSDINAEAADIVQLASVKKQSMVKTDGIEELLSSASVQTAEAQPTAIPEAAVGRTELPGLSMTEAIEKIRELVNQTSVTVEPQRELTLTLAPETLGRIAVRVSQSEQGISIVMSAQNTATEKLLQDNIGSLSAAVRNQGSEIVDIRVIDPTQAGFMAELNLGGYGNPQQQSGGSGTSATGEAAANEAEAAQSADDYSKEAILWQTA